jgi:hypothetical protein
MSRATCLDRPCTVAMDTAVANLDFRDRSTLRIWTDEENDGAVSGCRLT